MSTNLHNLKRCLLSFLVVLLTYGNLAPLAVQAAESTPSATPTNTERCGAPLPAVQINYNAGDDEDPGDAVQYPFISDTELDSDPMSLKNLDPQLFEAQLKTFIQTNVGWRDDSQKAWFFCSSKDMEGFLGLMSFSQAQNQYFDTLSFPTSKIIFQNPLDRYALTGEPCTRYIDKVCDETKGADGKPLYYDDTIWPNEHWDAPKADARILKTLVYLVTPLAQGGAGRERIKVGKIIQPTDKNREFAPLNNQQAGEIQLDEDTPASEDPSSDSAHTYDLVHPSAPTQVSKAVDITEIDNVRITTKIVQKRRIGGDTTSYNYTSLPIKVSYQTDQGVQDAPLVPTDIYGGALSGFTLSLGQILDQFGLDATIDASSIDVTNLGDVAGLIGQSLITQLLSSPNGSLKGWDFPSLVDQLGRIYLASQLGLSPNALLHGSTVDDILTNVGQSTVEKAFGFPADSLSGKTSKEVLGTLGRRTMEDVLGVSTGTLETKQYTQDELLERVGAGRIEKRFNLKPGTVSGTNSWSDLQKIPKFHYTFTTASATFVDDALNLGFQPVSTQAGETNLNMYGFSQNEVEDATAQLIGSGNPNEAQVAKYKRIVGARAIESGIGRFKSSLPDGAVQTDPQTRDFINNGAPLLGLKIFTGLPFPPTPPTGYTFIYKDNANVNGVNGWHGVMQNSTATAYKKLMEISDQDWDTMAHKFVAASETKQFTNVCTQFQNIACNMDPTTLSKNHGDIATYWKPFFQNGYTKTTALLANLPQGDVSNRDDLATLQKGTSAALGLVKGYDDAVLTFLQSTGQSGRSAALNLPAKLVDLNPDGSFGTRQLVSEDLVNAMLSGNFTSTIVESVGALRAAQRITNDLNGQSAITSILLKYGANITDQIQDFGTILGKYGVDISTWTNKGLEASDVDRIFIQDLAPEAFKRLGQQEILRTIWHKADLQIKDGNGDINNLINNAGQIVKDIDFYLSRLNKLQKIGKDLSAAINSLGDLSPDLKTALQQLNGGSPTKSIDALRGFSRGYEPILAAIGASKASASIKNNAFAAQQILRELAAGHELDFNQPVDTPSTQNQQEERCFQYGDLRTFFSNGSASFVPLAAQIATCKLDASLDLPAGSLFSWYQSNDFSFDGLALAIGKTDARSHGTSLNDADAKARGKKLLESLAVGALAGLVPGLGNLGITAESIFQLLSGNTEDALRQIGGRIMDLYLNWKPGTALGLISPTCLDDTQKPIVCTGKQALNMRLSFMAQQGLKDLGLALNFPSSFSLIQDPNSPLAQFDLVTNFAISQISENFGLRPNTFYGDFAHVRSLNSAQNLAVGLGWYPTTPLRDLALFRDSLSQAGLNAAADAIDSFLDGRANAALDQIANAGTGFWGDPLAQAVTGGALLQQDHEALDAFLAQLRSEIQKAGTIGSSFVSHVDSFGQYDWTKFGTTYVNQVGGVKTRIEGLDSQYKLEKGTFKTFLTAGADAKTITGPAGKSVLGSALEQTVLDKLLKGTPFEELSNTFAALTDGCKISDLFLGSGGKCSGLSGISLTDIISADADEDHPDGGVHRPEPRELDESAEQREIH